MSNKIVDSHCHLNFPQFKDNLKEVVQKALDNKVSKMLTISTKLNATKIPTTNLKAII